MFRLLLALAVLLSVSAYSPMKQSRLVMAAEKNFLSRAFGAALVASTLVTGPAFAKEGDAPKINIFGKAPMSSPFVSETREDPIYSPYSPYGNGEKAVYNGRKGSADEVKFWAKKFEECAKRTEKIPGYAKKSTWFEITTELTRNLYNYRESMLRLASAAKDPTAATAAAKTYFQDLNDIYEFSVKKKADVVLASYDKSVKDLATFKSLVK